MNITELWKGCQVLVQYKNVKGRAKVCGFYTNGTVCIMPLYGEKRVVTPEQIIKKFD
jgi:hypothetical protein